MREFVYSGEPVPDITEEKHAEFYMQFQKSILASLKKRKFLSQPQYEKCIEEIEKRYGKTI